MEPGVAYVVQVLKGPSSGSRGPCLTQSSAGALYNTLAVMTSTVVMANLAMMKIMLIVIIITNPQKQQQIETRHKQMIAYTHNRRCLRLTH